MAKLDVVKNWHGLGPPGYYSLLKKKLLLILTIKEKWVALKGGRSEEKNIKLGHVISI